jgi:iron complex transport system ATP-binding protein
MSRPLEISGLTVSLGGRTVLEDVDLALEPGVVTGLVGPNGAGKTSLIRAALGLVPARLGEVRLAGRALHEQTTRERARLAGYLPQSRSSAWAIRGHDLVALGRFAWGGRPFERLAAPERAIVERAIARVDASAYAHRPVTELSGGERARLHLARALAAQAPLLMLDEPASALDPRHQIEAMTLLAEEAASGRAVLVALHDLAAAKRWCGRVVVLDGGKIVADGPPEQALRPAILKSVFGVAEGPGGLIPA